MKCKQITKKLSLLLALLLLSLQLCGCGGAYEQLAPAVDQEQAPAFSEQEAPDAQESDPAFAEQPADPEQIPAASEQEPASDTDREPEVISEDASYTTPEDVALYLHTYDHLPPNYITKKEAKRLGWSNKEGNLWDVAPGCSIGGDYFGNYEGSLPEKKGRDWHECDVNYQGGYRGGERLLYSTDGLIYYTEDHYKTFTQMY